MAKTFRLLREEPLLNIASYARGGPQAADRLTPAQIEHIRLTINRAPEAVVKVLPRSGTDLRAVGKHIDYISRRGSLDVEGDEGERLRGRIGAALLEDWDLDIDDVRRQGSLAAVRKLSPPKIIHKLMFSMPPGTSPQRVLSAVHNFAREEFYGQHRYALVLHTDEPHPHVHLVLKAVSEQGVRLNIKKATLRHWRSQFASHLRAVGVAANATERAVRSESRSARKDGIYRASLRGDSAFVMERFESVTRASLPLVSHPEPGDEVLLRTRANILKSWRQVADLLEREGEHQLSLNVFEFIATMTAHQTERERYTSEWKATVAEKRLIARHAYRTR